MVYFLHCCDHDHDHYKKELLANFTTKKVMDEAEAVVVQSGMNTVEALNMS